MKNVGHWSPVGGVSRVRAVSRWLMIGLGLAMSVGTGASFAASGGPSVSEQAQVEDLPVCYARGTDTLGRAVNAMHTMGDLDSTMNIGDEEFDAALALYRACFSRDFAFTLAFDGVPVLTVPDPNTRTRSTDAALQWANFVNNAFRPSATNAGYRNTQHHMGSISSEIRGRTAQIVSYLIATHAFLDPTLGVNVVGGTYSDQAVRENGRWVLKQRTLNITSSVVTPGS